MDKTEVDQAFAEFKARFPDFKSFNEPGTRFVQMELNYKHELSEEFQKVGKEFLEGNQTDIFDEFVKFFKNRKLKHLDNRPQNLTNFNNIMEVEKILGAESELRKRFTFHVRDLLQTADDDQRVWEAIDGFINFLTKHGLQAAFTKVWPTIVLFLWRPKKYIYIKPMMFDQVLVKLAIEKLGFGVPLTADLYKSLMGDMTKLSEIIGATDFIEVQSFLWVISQGIDTSESIVSERPKNVILFGPPGTGKTYALRQLFNEYSVSTGIVSKQELLQNTLEDMNAKWWEVLAIALRDIGRATTVPEVAAHEYVLGKAKNSSKIKVDDPLFNSMVHGLLGYYCAKCNKEVNRANFGKNDLRIFWKDSKKQWTLVKNWDSEVLSESALERLQELERRFSTNSSEVDEKLERYDFVTFHQSYSYEEFVEGIRMTLDENERTAYQLVPGIFKRICERADRDPSNQYAIFIDEINRGNISKIFGELITLIEPDKRKGGKNELIVKLPYSREKFTVPSNLDIYGTMNTADRSLVQIDTALRRRFQFKELTPDHSLLSKIDFGDTTIDLRQMLKRMNQRIEAILDREHKIGHAYFFNESGQIISGTELPQVFKDKILPLLTEYFFEDWSRVRVVLGDDKKVKTENQFIEELKVDKKVVHDKDALGIETVYRLNKIAFDTAQAYKQIYEDE
ncbi:MAG: AAA family ATPase [Gammaproteobacteria bacterium]|nr:AAA family ATPase [Gammaproteobacteria bacterium]